MSPPNPSPPKSPLVPRLNPKGLSNIWNRETSQHMPPCPPLNPSPPKSPLVPRLNPKGLSNIWNRETSQHMPPCPPLNPSPPKSPLVPRLNPKGLSNIFKLLLFRGECDPRPEVNPLTSLQTCCSLWQHATLHAWRGETLVLRLHLDLCNNWWRLFSCNPGLDLRAKHKNLRLKDLFRCFLDLD